MSSIRERIRSEVDDRYPLYENFQVIMEFMLDALELVYPSMSPRLQGYFNTAKEHWGGRLDGGAELLQARLDCWRYLDQIKADVKEGADKEIAFARAIICVLYSEPQGDDTYELVDWFLIHLTRSGAAEEDIWKVAEGCFPGL
jgi:hypothetical protein